MIAIFLCLVLAQSPDLATSSRLCPDPWCPCTGGPCTCGPNCPNMKTLEPSYAEQLAKAKASGRGLVVGVCCKAPVGHWLRCRTNEWRAWEGPTPRLIVSRGGDWICDLPATATAEEIAEALKQSPPLFQPPAPVQPARVSFVAPVFTGRSACPS